MREPHGLTMDGTVTAILRGAYQVAPEDPRSLITNSGSVINHDFIELFGGQGSVLVSYF